MRWTYTIGCLWLLGILPAGFTSASYAQNTTSDIVNNCWIWNDKDNGIQVEGKGCRQYLQKPGCYQKMREAIRKINTVIAKSGKFDDVGVEIAITHLWIATHVQPVMKECVE